jgi:hypothetical protein
MLDSDGRCGAKTRSGAACTRFPTAGKRRCRLHGGAPGSGAPCAEKNGRYRHGSYSRVKRAERERAANKLWAPIPPPTSWPEN